MTFIAITSDTDTYDIITGLSTTDIAEWRNPTIRTR